MKLLLPYFIIFIVVLQLKLRKYSKKEIKDNENFWKRESEANSVRKKDISNLNYITIPDTLPFIKTQNCELSNAQNEILELKDKKILNLSNKSNTDLKIEYGVSNLTILSEYDDNFVSLIRALDRTGQLAIKDGYLDEGRHFLEYAVSIGSDIKNTYKTLTDIYNSENNSSAIDSLLTKAEELSSISKTAIVNYIKMPYQS